MATLILTAAASSATSGAFAAGGWAVSGFSGFLVSAAAAAIDARVLYPMLFKQDPSEGARLNGLDFQKTDQGSPANRLFGGKVRIAGTLIWSGPLVEYEDRSAGGKGPGSGGNFIIYKYKTSVAVEIARLKRGKEIKKVSKVFADGKQFYNESGVQTVTSNKLYAETIINTTGGDETGWEEEFIGKNAVYLYKLKIISDEAALGPNLPIIFQSGRNITISGFANNPAFTGLQITNSGASAATNAAGSRKIRVQATTTTGKLYANTVLTIAGTAGTYVVNKSPYVEFTGTGTVNAIDVPIKRVYQSGETYSSSTEYGLATGVSSQVITVNTTTIGASVENNGTYKVISTGRVDSTKSFIVVEKSLKFSDIYPQFFQSTSIGPSITLTQEDTTFSRSQATDVRFYTGSRTQPQDPSILEVQLENTPAYRGRAYMVVEDLELTDFGNRIPNFEFLVEVEDDDSLSYALSEMFKDCGITESGYDFSAISASTKLGGFAIRGPTQYKSALQPIMISKFLISQQNESKIKLIPRTATSVYDVTNKTAVSFAGEKPASRPASFTEGNEDDVVQNTTVKFYDSEDNLQVGAQEAAASDSINAQVGIFDSNITMTKTEAKQLANTLFEASRVANLKTIKFTLPPSYLGIIKEGVRVSLTALNQSRQYLITRVDEGVNYILECEGYEEDLEPYTQTVTGA